MKTLNISAGMIAENGPAYVFMTKALFIFSIWETIANS